MTDTELRINEFDRSLINNTDNIFIFAPRAYGKTQLAINLYAGICKDEITGKIDGNNLFVIDPCSMFDNAWRKLTKNVKEYDTESAILDKVIVADEDIEIPNVVIDDDLKFVAKLVGYARLERREHIQGLCIISNHIAQKEREYTDDRIIYEYENNYFESPFLLKNIDWLFVGRTTKLSDCRILWDVVGKHFNERNFAEIIHVLTEECFYFAVIDVKGITASESYSDFDISKYIFYYLIPPPYELY